MKKSSKAGRALCRKNRYNKSASGCRDTERENNMNETSITTELLAQYAQQLYEEEKSSATIEKYIRDVHTFSKYAGSQALTKELTIAYKRDLPTRGYTILSVNSMLASLNSLLVFCGRTDCKVKLYRVQKKTYLAANRELSKAEYLRLLHAARKDQRLWLLLQTLCATGIRVSELQYFTVEAVRAGEISVACKNKMRSILIPQGTAKHSAAIRAQRGDRKRAYLPYPDRQADEPQQYLVCHEAAVCAGKRKSGQGVSPQSEEALCPDFLSYGEGYCKTGRYSRSQQHQHDAHLHHVHRHRTPPPNGKAGFTCLAQRDTTLFFLCSRRAAKRTNCTLTYWK